MRYFHINLPAPRYVKIFQPNPTRLPDGAWKTYPGGAEISFCLQTREVREAFLEHLKVEARALGIPDEISIL